MSPPSPLPEIEKAPHRPDTSTSDVFDAVETTVDVVWTVVEASGSIGATVVEGTLGLLGSIFDAF